MIILRTGTTQFNLAAMADAYRRQGTSRVTLIEAIRYHVQEACTDLTVDQVEQQVRLAANTIFTRVGQSTMGMATE